ncbi:hypothetical protein BARBAKC583_1031 [Bartonella bacilliformis KC583]|uniref:Uncharacterized protein n=1 Tax=Bartonella bacilliformis (strain ATCC 35685 / KC583 / Herrer 020/F12,63) TaxID=360095 RepID=A1UTK5_BARBK|nr:hypothetical protein BARBAKC583_1031 [Bartonella bacilliformis KC583]
MDRFLLHEEFKVWDCHAGGIFKISRDFSFKVGFVRVE